jgi:hypothetical protein
MRIRDILSAMIGTLCIFAVLYAALLFAHGMGW